MQRHGGSLVHSVRDDYGLLEVVDQAEFRSLYFETPIQQSSINLRQPETLVFEYYRVMCLLLLFRQKPESLLILGLGGGALARFLLSALSETKLTTVEFRESVVDLAYDYFQLPVTPQLETWVADAHAYLVQAEQAFPLMFIDLYDAMGMSESLSSIQFFDDCKRRLDDQGVVAINLWRTKADELHGVQQILADVFGDEVLYLDVDDANTVALAFNDPESKSPAKALRERARALELQTSLDLGKYVRRLRCLDGTGYC